jgi:hypothetical protein
MMAVSQGKPARSLRVGSRFSASLSNCCVGDDEDSTSGYLCPPAKIEVFSG